MKTLADRLKEERTARGWSQKELARVAEVTQGTIGNIEAGTRLRPREILKIAAALGVRAEWLQDGDEPRVHPPITGQAAGTLGQIYAGDEGSGAMLLQASEALAARHQSLLTLDRALPVVLDALADLPPARAASVRAQLDLVREHPEMKGDVLAELLNLLAEPSKGRIAA